MADPDDITPLLHTLELLGARVEALEAAAAAREPAAGAADSPVAPGRAAALPDEVFWALTGLRARRDAHASTAQGTVMLVGSVTLPSGAPVEWQQGAGTEGLLEVDWSSRAAGFAALGHPVRLELLRHVLAGVSTTAELAAMEALGTTGQLHHHLRLLLGAGWLTQSARGSYEVPAARVVPLLACLVGVER